MACLDCGNDSCTCNKNPNPIDGCSRSFLSCNNPCQASEQNTVDCESLPSRLENFSRNFFGEVFKTEINGKVQWSLPCGLDVGLPNNPRGVDEGLACYFLRLFQDGIVGLTGPQGIPGSPGQAGHNAYTVTLQGFSPPPVGQTVTVQTLFNPVMLPQEYVFIDTAGWYQIISKDDSGNLTLG